MLSHTAPFSPPPSHNRWSKNFFEKKSRLEKERFFTPTRVFGSPDEQWCEAGGAAATSKGKSGGRMAGEENQSGGGEK